MMWFVYLLLPACYCFGVLGQGCSDRFPLGMTNGFIKANQITASSVQGSYSMFQPHHARLHSTEAWCSVSQSGAHWLQVEFTDVTYVTGFAIQGSPHNTPTQHTISIKVKESVTGTWNDAETLTYKELGGDSVHYHWKTPSKTKMIQMIEYASTQLCLRIEIYGCMNISNFLPLGMQSKIINDNQLSGQGLKPQLARLYTSGDGVVRQASEQMYLQIDFGSRTTVTAISMQGSLERQNRADTVLTYQLSSSDDGMTFQSYGQDFNGNINIGADAVMNILPTPIHSRYLRIDEKKCRNASYCVMKVEVYGYGYACHHDLNTLIKSSDPSFSSHQHLGGTGGLCFSPGIKDFFHFEFNDYTVVSGILMEGGPNNDVWIKSYELFYEEGSNTRKSWNNQKLLIGNTDRFVPMSANWLSPPIFTRNLWIKPIDSHGNNKCMRISLKGCALDSVVNAPQLITTTFNNGDVTISWSVANLMPEGNGQFLVNIKASKKYDDLFVYTRTVPVNQNIDLRRSLTHKINFRAAKLDVMVGAHYNSISKYSQPIAVYVQPKEPVQPIVSAVAFSNTSMKGNRLIFEGVDQLYGPISEYQVIISSEVVTIFSQTELLSQESASDKGLNYFLAATVLNSSLTNNNMAYEFVEGLENVDGLDGKLETITTYYVYVRAVIRGKDIVQYGFENKDYYGQPGMVMLERKTLNVISNIESTNAGTIINVAMGPENTEFYQIIAMKLNKTLPGVKYPSNYADEEFKLYEDADYNEPYIAAMFNSFDYDKYSSFKLGDDASYVFQASSSRKRREADNVFKNGRLTANETYVVFQRVKAGGNIYSSPWSNEFSAVNPAPPVSTVAPETKGSDVSTALYAGVAVAVAAVLIVIIVLCIVLYRRKKKKQWGDNSTLSYKKSSKELEIMENGNHESTDCPNEDVYSNLTDGVGFPAIKIEEFGDYYVEQKRSVNSEITEQYESIPAEGSHPSTVASTSQNRSKNRYQNITAYDHTRVKLKSFTGNEKSDYVNANYIRDYFDQKLYIATQAPKTETIFDFWRLVLGEKTPAIVMLTKMSENGKKKCVQYWPEFDQENYGGIDVSVYDTQVFADYTLRKMEVRYENHVHHLLHFHFTSWPDHGCPEYPTVLLNFCYRFRQMVNYDSPAPSIIHCSAGVGRTGTMIIIDAMLYLIQTKQLVDIYNYFAKIRDDRSHVVQTLEQYLFTYAAIYEHLYCGKTVISSSAFSSTYKKMISATGHNQRTKLQLEFEKLDEVTIYPDDDQFSDGRKPENVKRNRHPNILPCSSSRVFLPPNSGHGDYINAVFVDGYKNKDGIIVTEAPLEETIDDFWLLALEYNVTTIIVLFSPDETQPAYPKFWPHEDKKFGEVQIILQSRSRSGNMELLSYQLANNLHSQSCNLVHLNDWQDHKCASTSDLIKLFEEVLKSQQVTGDGRILVTCSDGANRSGTFIACQYTIDQLKNEQNIDIFQNVRRARLVRPQFVETFEQYRLIYELVNRYLELFSEYSNFT